MIPFVFGGHPIVSRIKVYNSRVGIRLRIWMPLAAVLIVLLSIVLMFLYGVPAIRTRLTDYAETRTFTQAAADALAEAEGNLRRELDLSARTTGGEILVVDPEGRIVAQANSGGGFQPSREVLQTRRLPRPPGPGHPGGRRADAGRTTG